MRTTLNLDDDLIGQAMELTGITQKTELLHRGLRELIEREAARQLAEMGGTAPDFQLASRHRRQKCHARPR
ncbi:MAG: type II toxin-antitoxin system VapB family antitoxin [Chthoniobacterales bacterium]